MATAGAAGGGKTFSFKVVLLGEGCVGKTSLVLRYCENKFNDKHITTLQVRTRTRTGPGGLLSPPPGDGGFNHRNVPEERGLWLQLSPPACAGRSGGGQVFVGGVSGSDTEPTPGWPARGGGSGPTRTLTHKQTHPTSRGKSCHYLNLIYMFYSKHKIYFITTY